MPNNNLSNQRKRPGVSVALFAIVIAVLSSSVYAQEAFPAAEELQQSRTLNEAKRQATIGANVEFSLEESQKFWPMFWQYRTEVNQLDDRYVEFLREFADNFHSMSNRKAKTLTDGWLDIETERMALKREYIGKFNEVLPAAKTMRVAQIENKLDMMLNLSLTKRVPLLPAPE